MSFFISISIWLVVGGICFQVAKHRGRNPITWFFIGFILGIIGLIVLYIMPKRGVVSPSVDSGKQEDKPAATLVKSEGCCEATYLWYYLDESDKQHGPMSFDAFRRAWDSHHIIPSTYIWNRSMTEWKRIEEMPDLLVKIHELSGGRQATR